MSSIRLLSMYTWSCYLGTKQRTRRQHLQASNHKCGSFTEFKCRRPIKNSSVQHLTRMGCRLQKGASSSSEIVCHRYGEPRNG